MAQAPTTTKVHGASISVGEPTPEQRRAHEEWLLEHGTAAQKQAVEKRRRRQQRRLAQ